MATRKGYNRITISERLLMSAGFVDRGAVVADIGCDHAFTDIWLIKNEICSRCIAMDLREGPLEHAKENVGLYGVADRVELRLSYGLDELKPGEADTVLITGMGGTLMCDILERGREVATAANTLILQPQSDIASLRAKVYELGFYIANEEMCLDEGKFYVSVKAVKGAANGTEEKANSTEEKTDSTENTVGNIDAVGDRLLSPVELEYGPIMLKKQTPVFRDYLDYHERKYNRMKNQIEQSGSGGSSSRISEINEKLALISEARALYIP